MEAFLKTLNYSAILPEMLITLFGLIILVWDLFTEEKRQLAYVALTGIVVALLSLFISAGFLEGMGLAGVPHGDYFAGMVRADNAAFFMKGVFLLVAGLIILLSMEFMGERTPKIQVEYYELVLFATLGMMFMAGSRDIVMIYLGLELTSQCSYIMAGLLRKDPKSNEAALKYFLNGALASAVLLFGVSLLYGLTGVTHLEEMAYYLANPRVELLGAATGPLLVTAVVFVVAGFAFKVAAAPFHLWAPDAYEGAPTPVTAFFSAGPKAAAFAAIVRVFLVGLPALAAEWAVLFAVLSAASMFIGNLTALMQSNMKRMMAYSSISHAGYLLIGVVAGARGTSSVLFYLLAYAMANLGIFAIIVALENAGGDSAISAFKGLFYRAPVYAVAMLFFFISLIGIPPTVGFFGKFFLFQAALDAGWLWLAILMAVNSAISVGYYYGVVRTMFFDKPAVETLKAGNAIGTVVALAALGVLLVALMSGPFIGYAAAAGLVLF